MPILVFGAFSMLMFIFSVQQYERFERNIEERTITALKERLARISGRAENLIKNNLEGLVANDIADFAVSAEVRSIMLIDENGRVRQGSQIAWKNRPVQEIFPRFDRTRFLAAQKYRRPEILLSADRTGIIAYQPVELFAPKGQIRPTHIGMIVADYDLSRFKSEQRNILVMQGITLWSIGLVLMISLWFFLYRWLTRPLSHLKDIVHRHRIGDYAARADISGKGELVELSASFNALADEVLRNSASLQAILNAATEYAIIARTWPASSRCSIPVLSA